MTQPRLIGLGHRAQAGKDTLADILFDLHAYKAVSFATPLKAMLEDLNPIVTSTGHRLNDLPMSMEEKKKMPEVRRLLQHLGSSARYRLHQGVWVAAAMQEVDKILRDPQGRVVVTDVRHVNEAEAIKKRGGVMVRVDRPGLPKMEHESETAMADYDDWDHVVHNDGDLNHLRTEATVLLDTLGAEGDEEG